MHVTTVIGARPQIIKAATVSRAMRDERGADRDNPIVETIVHTGQHFDHGMSDVFVQQLDLPRPDYNLGISGLGHGAMTGRMLEGIEELLLQNRPDIVLVYGDTNSTLAAALGAIKLHIPVAHVEAGLRSGNMAMPEEVNRILTDRVSQLLLCPTRHAVENLQREGFPYPCRASVAQKICQVGDVMFDAVLYYRERARDSFSLDTWGVEEGSYVLCTLHRQENTDDPARLEEILRGLRAIAQERTVLLPLHPRTEKILREGLRQDSLEGLKLIEPVPYLQMQRLAMDAYAIVTDSGGLQKEAFFHGVPCITARDETEWLETVELGWNHVVGADADKILSAYQALEIPASQGDWPYGRGDAAPQIVELLNDVVDGDDPH